MPSHSTILNELTLMTSVPDEEKDAFVLYLERRERRRQRHLRRQQERVENALPDADTDAAFASASEAEEPSISDTFQLSLLRNRFSFSPRASMPKI